MTRKSSNEDRYHPAKTVSGEIVKINSKTISVRHKKLQEKMLRDLLIQKTIGPVKNTVGTDLHLHLSLHMSVLVSLHMSVSLFTCLSLLSSITLLTSISSHTCLVSFSLFSHVSRFFFSLLTCLSFLFLSSHMSLVSFTLFSYTSFSVSFFLLTI